MKAPHIYVMVFVSLLALGACGTEDIHGSGPSQNPETWVNRKPTLFAASPGALAVGEQLEVLGQYFIDKTHGQTVLQFKGTFFDDQGKSEPVELQSNPTLVNTGKLEWQLWPNIIFSSSGNRLGRFVGSLVVINTGKDGSQEVSDPFPLTLDIKPSLIPRMVKPLSAPCAAIVPGTYAGQPMVFTAEAVGMRPGTKDAPLTFRWSFMADHFNVKFDNGMVGANLDDNKGGSYMIEDRVTSGNASTIQDGSNKFFLWKFVDDVMGDSRLKELRTGQLPSEANSVDTTVNVAATDASGKTTSLSIKFKIHRKAELIYDKKVKIAERFEPVMVTECMNGGDIGRDVGYHENKSESRSKSLGFSMNAGLSAGGAPGALLPGPWANPWALNINFSAGFGTSISGWVSSDKSKGLSLNGHILPGDYGVFYRQTTKIYRIGKMIGYDMCGSSFYLGDAILTDWLFTPDLATGSHCPPTPNLQPAQKLM